MSHPSVTRREFLATTSAAAMAAARLDSDTTVQAAPAAVADPVADSLVAGQEWTTLNPGYWQIKDGVLRRRLINVGDRARSTGFPFHAATKGVKFETAYDPSLPTGIIYRNDWKLADDYTLNAEFTYRESRPEPGEGDDPGWQMYSDGYARMGVAIGSKSLLESYGKIRNAIQIVWCDDDSFQIVPTGRRKRNNTDTSLHQRKKTSFRLKSGDRVSLSVRVSAADQNKVALRATMQANGQQETLTATVPAARLRGYVGIAARGLLDFEVNSFAVTAAHNKPDPAPVFDCFSCYPLGDTLKNVNGQWQCRFVGLFASDGVRAELRIADSETPPGGWQSVPVAGAADIVSHEWRRNTAVITATLPESPANTTLYYTVWKDGQNVTSDPRIGSSASGPGTGFVGDVPADGGYVGRLPQLKAPYKLCGLSCHAITGGLQQKTDDGWKILGGSDDWQFRDQPTTEAYKHLEDYNFQVMVWEDDVWYMELVLYPPSTDDAYRVVTNSICGPTSRWQMMRHWNVINPGDHDYGMDDIKGPEQLILRRVQGLGQDTDYLRRNFQIVHHLITGDEDVDPLANPKKWRAWKMPDRDFTFVILDSRLWRSSQDTDIWDDAGWDAFKNLYDRTDPTRSLLGEEQFAWLQNLIQTDSSPLICLTGINGMHTVWTGTKSKGGVGGHIQGPFDQRDRVTADYAGWVKAGADRVLELLGSRDGVVSVYGDVHNGCIMKNQEHNVIECSFGPIGRNGGRAVIPGFGRRMKDFDGRAVEVYSLYHQSYADPELNDHAQGDPYYWNFVEMAFNPTTVDSSIELRVRNLVDPPSAQPRGGGSLETTAAETGRDVTCRISELKTLPHADVRFATTDGTPVRATRSDAEGIVRVRGLVDVPPDTQIIVTAFDGKRSQSQVITTS